MLKGLTTNIWKRGRGENIGVTGSRLAEKKGTVLEEKLRTLQPGTHKADHLGIRKHRPERFEVGKEKEAF